MFSGKKKNWISFYVVNVRSWLKIGSPFQNFWVLFWLGNRRLLTACGKYTIFGYWSDKELSQINATQSDNLNINQSINQSMYISQSNPLGFSNRERLAEPLVNLYIIYNCQATKTIWGAQIFPRETRERDKSDITQQGNQTSAANTSRDPDSTQGRPSNPRGVTAREEGKQLHTEQQPPDNYNAPRWNICQFSLLPRHMVQDGVVDAEGDGGARKS